MRIKIKKLREGAVIPTRATDGSAAYDVYCPSDQIISDGRQIIPLGFALAIPEGYEAKIEPRSGYSSKGFVATLADTEYRIDADVLQGKIDADYRGEIGVIVKASIDRQYVVKAGQRIAQMTIYKVEDAGFMEVSELDATQRGEGGFGHTGR